MVPHRPIHVYPCSSVVPHLPRLKNPPPPLPLPLDATLTPTPPLSLSARPPPTTIPCRRNHPPEPPPPPPPQGPAHAGAADLVPDRRRVAQPRPDHPRRRPGG